MVRIFPSLAIALFFFSGTLFSNNLSASINTKSISVKGSGSSINTLADCQLSVNAGFDIITCEGTSIQLLAEINGMASSVIWVSLSGKGEFDDPSVLNPIFTPATEDNGSTITLEFTAFDEDSNCQATDLLELSIFRLPEVNAGENIVICEGQLVHLNGLVDEEDYVIEWEGGSGLFANIFSSETTYEPTILDPNPLVLTLTARDPIGTCEAVRSDITITFISSPVVDAGSDTSICGIVSLDLSLINRIPSAENADRYEWTTDGSGFFNDPTLLTPVYTSEISDFGKIITLTVNAFGDNACDEAMDQLELLINDNVFVDAGSNEATFVDQAFNLVNSSIAPKAENMKSVLWTTNGAGTFNDPTQLLPIYTPAESDENKEITLSLTAEGYCETITDEMFLNVESIVLGINPNKVDQKFKVFLDAANNNLVVDFGSTQHKETDWHIFDLSGKIHKRGKFNNGQDRYLIKLDWDTHGVYVFKVDDISRKLLLHN